MSANPKDRIGAAKAPISCIPAPVIFEIGLAMMEGARKYGRHNWRAADVRASVYYDAAFRHLAAWWEGEDIDPQSGISHLAHAMASLAILRDANGRRALIDDRPPETGPGWMARLNERAAEIVATHPQPVEPVTHQTLTLASRCPKDKGRRQRTPSARRGQKAPAMG
ncbi:MAG: dATP/dGTP diphosphohydrolase domain-containing protein [Hyphomonadaceae bacterium]